jgi:hypothetical protein
VADEQEAALQGGLATGGQDQIWDVNTRQADLTAPVLLLMGNVVYRSYNVP